MNQRKMNYRTVAHGIMDESGLSPRVEKEMNRLRNEVSEDLYDRLVDQLLPFSEGLQMEMAMNLNTFVEDGLMNRTGCTEADLALNECYTSMNNERASEEADDEGEEE
jgi:hypothetical protein